MPLPAALAARLAKRGIYKGSDKSSHSQPKHQKTSQSTDEVEEVFAEDYDDLSVPAAAPETSRLEQEADALSGSTQLIHETIACPNKHNPYHKCMNFCKTRWGYKEFEADQFMEKRRQRMLRKYPLPENWLEVADPDTGRFYYWNTQTEEVSWLAPLHPKAQISLSAEQLKNILPGISQDASDSEGEEEAGKDEQSEEDMEEDDDDLDDFEELEREVLSGRWEKEMKQARKMEKDRHRETRKGRQKEEIDPMDPAAYSDVPRGSWSTGLDVRGTAKTGVDVTASGPLFQQRPYPSPGAILRMNKKIPSEEDDD